MEEDKENVDPCAGLPKMRDGKLKGRERRVLGDITERFAHLPLRSSSCSAHDSDGMQAASVKAARPKRKSKSGLQARGHRNSRKLQQQPGPKPVSMPPVMLCTGVR